MPEARLVDDLLTLKAAGLIAASAAVATIVDVGSGKINADMVIDVSALEIASNDEIYKIVLQGSPDSDFGTDTSIQDLVQLTLSAAEVKETDSNKDDTVGHYVVPVTNEFDGTKYRYLRLYTVVAGSVAAGINYSARLTYPKSH